MGLGDLPILDHTDQGIRMLEEERRRMARDLHDGPAQALTNISMRLSVLRSIVGVNPSRALEEIDRINSRLVETVNEIRRLIYDLRPVAIDETGLTSAIQELRTKWENDVGIPVVLAIANGVTDDIAPAKQVAIYRLIKEIMNNIAKHAQATEVTIYIERSGCELVTLIRDDGKGFDPSVVHHGHYGLIGIRERADFLGGSLDIQSAIGQGASFFLRVPVYPGVG